MKVVNTGSLFMLGKVTLEALQWAQLALWGFSQCTAGTLELFKGHNWHFGGFSEGTAGTLDVLQRAQLALWGFLQRAQLALWGFLQRAQLALRMFYRGRKLWKFLRGHSWHWGFLFTVHSCELYRVLFDEI